MTPLSETDALERRIAQAEAAVAALADQFLPSVRDEVETLKGHLATARQAPGANAEAMRAAYEIVHVVKGQGGSFGYPLITDVGDLLCRLMHEGRDQDRRTLDLIDEHVRVLSYIIDRKLSGDGGDQGKALMDELNALNMRYAA